MDEPDKTAQSSTQWRQSKILCFSEFALIAAVYVADFYDHLFLNKVPYLFLLAWISLRLRGLGWRDIGFRVYRNWGKTLALGIAAGIGIELLELFCTQPLLARITGQMPDLSGFDRVAGNVKWLFVSLAFTWTLFAFGEELVFRGYILNRIAGLAGFTQNGRAIALVLTSALFGFSHLHQGITGVSENFIDGLILGVLYLGSSRSLAVPVLAHGVTDTVDFLLIFCHRYPGLH
jgi:membrane protease YdiL (CAAX protease family)